MCVCVFVCVCVCVYVCVIIPCSANISDQFIQNSFAEMWVIGWSTAPNTTWTTSHIYWNTLTDYSRREYKPDKMQSYGNKLNSSSPKVRIHSLEVYNRRYTDK